MRPEVIAEALALFDARADLYDQVTPVWHRHPFGDVSFAHEAANCAARTVSLLQLEQDAETDIDVASF